MFKRIFIGCMVFFILPISWAGMHPFFLSIMKIDHNAQAKSVEITIKVDTENLEQVLEDQIGERLLVGEKNENENTDNYIEKYLQRTLSFAINGKEMQPYYLGKEVKLDVTWLYLEITDVAQFNHLKLKNTLLLESGDAQTNIVRVKAKGKEKGEIMKDGMIWAELSF